MIRLCSPIILFVLVAAIVAGCGGGSSLERARERADAVEGVRVPVLPSHDAHRPDASAEVATPRERMAVRRELDVLAAAFAPVSARINFLVSAETLREDAVESDASSATQLERAGVVRVELRRMRTVLVGARPRVAAGGVHGTAARNVQQLLLTAIDSRMRALRQLESTLDGISQGVGQSIVDERFERYRSAWEQSVRSTREATTATQDERARVGLQPAPEEALR